MTLPVKITAASFVVLTWGFLLASRWWPAQSPESPTCPSVVVMTAAAPTGELDGAAGYLQCTAPGAPCRRYIERCAAINAMDTRALLECQREQGSGPFDPALDTDVWTEDDVRALETDDFEQLPLEEWRTLP